MLIVFFERSHHRYMISLGLLLFKNRVNCSVCGCGCVYICIYKIKEVNLNIAVSKYIKKKCFSNCDLTDVLLTLEIFPS